MKLIVISGRSGSGKSTALHALEDEGFSCIDNFPAGLLEPLIQSNFKAEIVQDLAVCIDARNARGNLEQLPEQLLAIDQIGLEVQIIFLDALGDTLIQRFSETRRRHPLTHVTQDLREAIEAERGVLSVISELADLQIDTTTLNAADLVSMIKTRVINKSTKSISLLFRSFAFKTGVPI
ncbi:MAG: RNase adapter RapZ, partial [Pseudomonadota bacterium]|nr:RNase adapter RapZ [Pseudomonadota bacterium]